METEKKMVYTIGIKIDSAEDYDRLRKNYSRKGLFGLDFEELHQGYPIDYPCFAEYLVDINPFVCYRTQLTDIINGGYKVQIYVRED